METRDPIQQMEALVREVHDVIGARSKPVLKRYPLTFAILLVFSLSAISYGFEIIVEHIAFFDRHPWTLLVGGVLLLFITGSLYRWLEHNPPA